MYEVRVSNNNNKQTVKNAFFQRKLFYEYADLRKISSEGYLPEGK